MTAAVTNIRVEDKLYQNRYVVDSGRPHIRVRPHEWAERKSVCPDKCLSGEVLRIE